jgi:hypothetical protein
MANPSKADIQTGLDDIVLALKENPTIMNSRSAYDALNEVVNHRRGRCPGTDYDELTIPAHGMGGVNVA